MSDDDRKALLIPLVIIAAVWCIVAGVWDADVASTVLAWWFVAGAVIVLVLFVIVLVHEWWRR